MTTPTGTISMANVNVELGRSSTASINLNETDVRTLAGVASGTISMNDLRGKTAVTISITNQTISDLDASAAYAYYFLTGGGQVEQSIQAAGINPTNLEQWCTPTNQSSNYEVLVTVTVGVLSGGSATGTWVDLSNTRNWYVEEFTSGNNNDCTFTVQIRRIGTVTVLDTATINLSAGVF